jgi:NADH-quinone oxidoreductase subunit J
MVLFLFVIMLLNMSEEDVAKLESGPRLHVAGAFFATGFLAALVWVCQRAGLFEKPLAGPEYDEAMKALGVTAQAGETAHVAVPLFQDYVLPFEIASFLLLAAIVGSVLITKRRLT